MKFSLSGIKETCLYVQDLEATEAFYTQKLGLACFDKKPGVYAFFRVGRDVLLCFNAEASRMQTALPPHYGSGQLHFAFECPAEDYEAWKQHIETLGIPIIQEAEWPNGVRSFYFHDPDGHVAEIERPGLWER